MTTPLPCESACGSPTFCPMPPLNAPRDVWAAFWRRHPARAGIPTLRREAAMRHPGGDVEVEP